MIYPNVLKRVLPLFVLIFSAAASADVLDEVLERGTIRFGVAEFIPWTMQSETGELIGFEIDVAKKLANDMGVKPEFKVYKWNEIMPALQNGEVDVLSGGMSITPTRALQVTFTNALAMSGVGLATNIDMTRDIGSLEELNSPEIKVAVSDGTLAESVAATLFSNATITGYENAVLAEKELVEGRAHVYVANFSEAKFLALRNEGKIDVPLPDPIIGTAEALAVRKGEQEMLNFLNAWIAARQADKWISTTRDYWFESLDWAADVKK